MFSPINPLLIFLLFFLLPVNMIAAGSGVKFPKEVSRLENLLVQQVSDGTLKEICIGIVSPQGILHSSFHGTSETKTYEIASISKTITAFCTMRLIADGKISLDQNISDFFPETPFIDKSVSEKPITIRHLLSHTAGFPDVRYYTPPKSFNIPGIKIPIPMQIYPPGVHYRYSNHGFILLGRILEQVTGKRHDENIRNLLILPGGFPDARVREDATGANGILFSHRDMVAYAHLMLRKGITENGMQLLSQDLTEKMFEEQIFSPPAKFNPHVGLSWRVERDENGILTYFHIGGADGAAAWIQFFPREEIAVFYLGRPTSYSDKVFQQLINLQAALVHTASGLLGSGKSIYQFTATPMPKENHTFLTGTYLRGNPALETRIRISNSNLILSNSRERVGLRTSTSHTFVGGRESLAYDFIFEPGSRKPVALATTYGYFKAKKGTNTYANH